MATIRIPTLLRAHTNGQSEIAARGDTVLHLLRDAATQYRGLNTQLFDEHGRVRGFVNLFVNDEDIRMHDGLETRIRETDVIEVLPAIAGGSGARATR